MVVAVMLMLMPLVMMLLPDADADASVDSVVLELWVEALSLGALECRG